MKLSRPQVLFLLKAYRVRQIAHGVAFSVWSYGATRTGRSLVRLLLIEKNYRGERLILSEAGLDILEPWLAGATVPEIIGIRPEDLRDEVESWLLGME